MTNWMEYMSNPRKHQLKQMMLQVLKERYAGSDQILERVGNVLSTEDDLKQFSKLVSDIYELAYLKAVQDHREQLQKAGLVAKIVPQAKDG